MENSKTSFFISVMTDGSAFSEDGDVFPVMASSPVVISDDEEGWGKRSSAATEIFCPGGSSS